MGVPTGWQLLYWLIGWLLIFNAQSTAECHRRTRHKSPQSSYVALCSIIHPAECLHAGGLRNWQYNINTYSLCLQIVWLFISNSRPPDLVLVAKVTVVQKTQKFWTITWRWLWTQQSNLFIRLMTVYHQTMSGCKRICSSEDIVETIIFWFYESSLWPWPWWSQNMMMHYHIKFGCKKLNSSKNIVRTNIQWNFELSPWPSPPISLSLSPPPSISLS